MRSELFGAIADRMQRVVLPGVEEDLPGSVSGGLIAEHLVDMVLGGEGQSGGRAVKRGVDLQVIRGGDDTLIADLTGPRSRTLKDTAARSSLPLNHMCGDTGARGLVPDIDKLHRQKTCDSRMIRVARDGAGVLQISFGCGQAVAFFGDEFLAGAIP